MASTCFPLLSGLECDSARPPTCGMYLVAGLLRVRDASFTATFPHTAADRQQPTLVLQLVVSQGGCVNELELPGSFVACVKVDEIATSAACRVLRSDCATASRSSGRAWQGLCFAGHTAPACG